MILCSNRTLEVLKLAAGSRLFGELLYAILMLCMRFIGGLLRNLGLGLKS